MSYLEPWKYLETSFNSRDNTYSGRRPDGIWQKIPITLIRERLAWFHLKIIVRGIEEERATLELRKDKH